MTTATLEHTRTFGRTGLRVSPLGFGGAPIGVLETEQDEVGRVLNSLLDAGVNVIDTAAMYYGSEEMIQRTIGHRRDEYVLISKCGNAEEESEEVAWSPELIRANVDRSLKRLGTDCIDVMLLHTCDLDVLKKGEALATLVEIRDAGKVRFVGYSGDNEAGAFAATLDDVAVIQTSINICDQNNIDVVLPEATANEIGVMVKRPIANAAWKPMNEQYEKYANYVKPYHERFTTMGLSLDALGIDGDPATVWPEVALRFVLSFPGAHTAIIGTTKSSHVEANLRAAAKGPLPNDVVKTIRAMYDKADPDRSWEGRT